MSDSLRLFVALELPADVRATLAVPEIAPLRSLPAEALHLTLAFLGSRPPSDVEAIELVLKLEEGTPAPRLSIDRSPLLLPPRRPRVLAVAVGDLDGTLIPLQARISAGLAEVGVYTPEKRPFRPHITTARLRPRVLWPRMGPSREEPIVCTAERVTLFESQLHPKGARYTPLTGAMLAH